MQDPKQESVFRLIFCIQKYLFYCTQLRDCHLLPALYPFSFSYLLLIPLNRDYLEKKHSNTLQLDSFIQLWPLPKYIYNNEYYIKYVEVIIKTILVQMGHMLKFLNDGSSTVTATLSKDGVHLRFSIVHI